MGCTGVYGLRRDIISGNFKGFAMLRQMTLSQPDKLLPGWETQHKPQPVYVEVRPETLLRSILQPAGAVQPNSAFGSPRTGQSFVFSCRATGLSLHRRCVLHSNFCRAGWRHKSGCRDGLLCDLARQARALSVVCIP